MILAPSSLAGYYEMAVSHIKPQANVKESLRWKVQSLAIKTIQFPIVVRFVLLRETKNDGYNNTTNSKIILQMFFSKKHSSN